MVKRVALLGSECSGKSTLSLALAQQFGCYQVPEYFRYYWQAKQAAGDDPIWTSSEFVHMAAEQCRFEDIFGRRSRNFLVCDTTPQQLAVWHKRYLGTYLPQLELMAKNRHYDLVLLCCCQEVPFQQDGVRDGEDIREKMQSWIEKWLQRHGFTYHVMSGPVEQRVEEASELMESCSRD